MSDQLIGGLELIEYRSGRESVVIEILKADVLAIDEVIKPTPLTGKSRRVQ